MRDLISHQLSLRIGTMQERMVRMADSNTEFPTTIGPDAVFKGQLEFEKAARLLGKFEGEVSSDGQFVVAEGAMLTGDARAGTIRVDGQVKGNLHANTKVQLTASARVEGDLEAARLEVAEGAVLVGRCTVGVDAKPPVAGQTKIAPVESVALPRPKDKEPAAVRR